MTMSKSRVTSLQDGRTIVVQEASPLLRYTSFFVRGVLVKMEMFLDGHLWQRSGKEVESFKKYRKL